MRPLQETLPLNAPPFQCVLAAWQAHEAELRHWLLSRLSDAALADDILQDVFLKALREGGHFCRLDSPRAWLYRVARHAVIDHHRLSKTTVPAEETLAQPEAAGHPVDALTTGLAVSLAALDPDDRDVIVRCDLEGQTQAAYATAHQLTLPAVKSRILRARVRLRQHLVEHAGVRFGPTGQVCCHGPFGQGD
jgi:RNA polymerase sigma-70 factor (ECF subfamily)